MTPTISRLQANPAFSDAAHNVLTAEQFESARVEIMQWDGYSATPLYSLSDLADRLGIAAVHYKHEGPRFGLGSFKALGGAYAAQKLLCRELGTRLGTDISLSDIRNRVWSDEAARITLVSATDGNHGRSLAWGSKRFGATCRIYIHENVSVGREKAMRDLGAEVVRVHGNYDASVARARDDAKTNGWLVVSDTSWPGYTETPRDVMAGYGVMVREVFDRLSDAPSHVFVQGGVGGLAAAVAAALRQLWGTEAPRVIVVEPDRAPCLFESARHGRASTVDITEETIMAGLSCGETSPLAWEVLSSEVSDFLTIDDSIIPPAVRRLARPAGGDPVIEAGESAVAGLAALIEAGASGDLREALGLDGHSRVLLIGSEGVTDPDIFAGIMSE